MAGDDETKPLAPASEAVNSKTSVPDASAPAPGQALTPGAVYCADGTKPKRRKRKRVSARGAEKETRPRRVGHPAFVPTNSERRFVQAMAGLRMSADEICAVIGSGRNGEDTGKPISKATLYRHFRNDLSNGRAMLKARVAGKFYAALDDDAPWAIQMAMRNQFGWDNWRSGFHVSLIGDDTNGSIDGTIPRIELEFVMPRQRELEDEPLPQREVKDVSPSRVEPAPRVDFDQPRTELDLQVNKPSSVPLIKPKGKFGWME